MHEKFVPKIQCRTIFVLFMLIQTNAQSKPDKTTHILIRHAEKDTSAAGSTMLQADPPLSNKGKLRAGKLVETLKTYTLDSLFSTNFNRTRSTALPIAIKTLPTLTFAG